MAYVLTAGMRNNNPGNIKFAWQPDAVGPSVNTDQGDPQAVYATPEAGMRAMYQLLLKKYGAGKRTPRQIIFENQGWTPGNLQAAQNIANYAGIGLDDDIDLTNPASAQKFMRALMRQEHGEASNTYTDQQLSAAINSTPVPAPPAREDPRRDTPSSGKPIGSQLPGPLPTTPPPVKPADSGPAPVPPPQGLDPALLLAGRDDPWSSLASGLASSVKRGRSGVGSNGLPETPPTPPPEFKSAVPEMAPPPAVGLPGTAQGEPMTNLADLFTIDPSRFGQAAILNVDKMGRPIRTRQYG